MNRLMIGALLLTAFGALNTQPAYKEETTAKEKNRGNCTTTGKKGCLCSESAAS
ncbi:hypothetical protein KEH51_27560 [[Brevibacterium] frigoritolerans]|uniref:YHYH domain-containing protein n=1 Tax=Peribacillus frigoritolerans TaxID=450367 RepID=A0A941FLB5_9BACI|nr:hypothetical protein [Peribacillus frigoritolerans]